MKRRCSALFPALLGAALAVGCTPATPPALDDEFAALAAQYMRETGAQPISAAELGRRLADGQSVVLLDVREADEQAVSTLRDAVPLPPDEVDTRALSLAEGATVVAYCTAGYRSGVAAVALEKRLGRPVLNLEGGIIAWFNDGGLVVDPSGRPVDRIHPYGEAWERYVRPRDSGTKSRRSK